MFKKKKLVKKQAPQNYKYTNLVYTWPRVGLYTTCTAKCHNAFDKSPLR